VSWLTGLWGKAAAAGLGLIVLAGLALRLVDALEAAGAARRDAADAKAAIAQKEADAALSAGIISRQAAALAALQDKANTALVRIENAPKTTGCGPVMRDASRSLHQLFGNDGQPPAGRQPAAAVR
jgi:hypothetical protein